MMNFKFLLVLVLVWGVCACIAFPQPAFVKLFGGSTPSNCTSDWSCADEGDDCNGDQMKNPTNCSLTKGDCCAAGLYCINSTCMADTVGDYCATNSTTSPCYGSVTAGYVAMCMNNTCTYMYGPGDTCTTNNDCMPPLTCNNSLCMGKMAGQACAVSSECSFGLYCRNFACSNMTASQGSACNGSIPCAPGNTCYNGTCAENYSFDEGAQCNSDTLCSGDNICYTNGTGPAVCTEPNDDLSSCTQNSDCNSGETCLCSAYSGTTFCYNLIHPDLNPCAEEEGDLSNCLVENQCSTAGDASNSCCYSNCYSEFKDANSCGCDLMEDIAGSCVYSPYCGGFPVWAIIVIIVVAIVLVLAIVLLVFFMMRRRRQYDSI